LRTIANKTFDDGGAEVQRGKGLGRRTGGWERQHTQGPGGLTAHGTVVHGCWARVEKRGQKRTHEKKKKSKVVTKVTGYDARVKGKPGRGDHRA